MRRTRPNLTLYRQAKDVYKPPPSTGLDGEFERSESPELQPSTPPVTAPTGTDCRDELPTVLSSRIGDYILSGASLSGSESLPVYRAVNIKTRLEYLCKVSPKQNFRETLSPYLRAGYHENLNNVHEVVLGEQWAYVFYAAHHGDLHTYLRSVRRLREPEAASLYKQIASVVVHCHDAGLILRDLKLRKFVFKDAERTELMLESLDDAIVLPDDSEDDSCTDRHGCPAYVSPEILRSSAAYSGRAADVWSLGVILYTMLVGRYPFHDSDAAKLFALIRRGKYLIPDTTSPTARCLLQNILRPEPSERLTAEDVLEHPWFKRCRGPPERTSRIQVRDKDQSVPEIDFDNMIDDDDTEFPI